MIRLAVLFPLTLLAAGFGAAADATAAEIEINQPWSLAVPPVSANGAAYMQIENRGDSEDRLTSATSSIAERVEIHRHVHQEGTMTMQPVDTVAIPAGGSAIFSPGGHHFMLFNLSRPLVAGADYPLTLQFEQAGEMEIRVSVRETAPLQSASTSAEAKHGERKRAPSSVEHQH